MAFTEEQLKKVNYLRASVRLQSPETETDPDYQFSDEELYAILETVTPAHNPDYTLGDLPPNQFYFVVLLAKKEIFYRLASTTAPFYPLSAEGAKLEKNVRFDHYLALIKVIMEEYETMKESSSGGEDGGGSGGTIQTYQASLLGQGKTYYGRYVSLSEEPFVELELSGITQTSVNLDWTKYDVTFDTNFLRYSVFISLTPVYDEYSVKPISPALKANYSIEDVRRTKLRISDLVPDTEYFVLIRTENKFGINGYSQKSFRTEAEVVIDAPIGN